MDPWPHPALHIPCRPGVGGILDLLCPRTEEGLTGIVRAARALLTGHPVVMTILDGISSAW